MRKDSVALLLIGFVIGFAALYSWTKERAPGVVRSTPRMPEGGPATPAPPGSSSRQGLPPAATPVDTARLQQLEDAVRANPQDFNSLVELGNAAFGQRNYDQAVQYYRRALDVNPRDVDVRTDLGTTFFFADRYDEAIAEFQKSLEINPTHPQSLFNLGVAYLQGKNDPDGAVKLWEKLIATNPDYPQMALVKEQLEIVREQSKK
jgi:cytochrome c-type biogenesis protein CcmH/NrfG